MANADRIAELYKGEIWDERAQRVARHRVDWLVAQARGAVLDVGCSQGIAAILCARRGLRTLGIDAEADRIEYASADRAGEPEIVRALVEFRVVDARRLDVPDASFDTLLLGEVVEHHVDASPILAEAVRVLRPSGVLALTTPFGYLPHHDHRATFFVGSLLDLLAPYVHVESLDVVDGYLRAVCRPGAMHTERHRELLAALQPVVEQEFRRTQRALREARSRSGGLGEAAARLDELEPRLAAMEQQRDQLAEMTDRLRGLEDYTGRLAGVAVRLDEAERELRESRESAHTAMLEQEDTISALRAQVRVAEDRLRGAEDSLQERGAALDEATGRLAETDRRLRHQIYRTQYVTWQLRSSFNRRWWRLGEALWTVGDKPSRLLRLPGNLLRAMRRHPSPEPPRRPGQRSVAAGPRADAQPPSKPAERPRPMMPDIPEVVLPDGPVVRPDLTVAVILDEFSATAFRYEWRQVEPGPDDWREVMERERPAMLFVESAWFGNRRRWSRHMHAPDAPSRDLRALTSWCRDHGIPTVFWNKEDPPNFDLFVETAKLFDWVFTVDGDCTAQYREVLGHDRVGVLPFAVQPRIHNPVTVAAGRRQDVAFGGTYFTHKHPERAEQMRTVLKPALDFGMHLYTRVEGDNPRYRWPDEYRKHIVGSLPYQRMLAAYKSYKVFLNVNSVLESPTMCARRIFELSASSTPVLSGHSRAIDEMFPGLVSVARTPGETRTLLAALLGSPQLRERQAHLAMREVFGKHTYTHRVGMILETLGVPATHPAPSISVLMVTNRPNQLDHAIEQVVRQSWRPLQLVLILHGSDLDPSEVRDKAVAAGVDEVAVGYADNASSLGSCLNQAVEAADGDLLAKMDDDNLYGEHYLSDLAAAFRYTDAQIVGKRACYTHLRLTGATVLRQPEFEHTYVDMVNGGTLLAGADVFQQLPFDDVTRGEDTRLLQRARQAGLKIYSADRFSYVYVRNVNPRTHTWEVDDIDILRTGRVEFYGQPEEHVLI